MEDNTFNKKYIEITDLIQKEFNRNVDLHGARILCHKGCSHCCHQIFNITMADAYVIGEHINSLEVEKQYALKEKAKEYLEMFKPIDKSSEAYFNKQELPCPALSAKGECTIYEARPVICRKFGPPIYDYKNPEKIFACVLNFKDGEELIDEDLIPNQTYVGMKWDELKTEFNVENGNSINSSTTIAGAILNQ